MRFCIIKPTYQVFVLQQYRSAHIATAQILHVEIKTIRYMIESPHSPLVGEFLDFFWTRYFVKVRNKNDIIGFRILKSTKNLVSLIILVPPSIVSLGERLDFDINYAAKEPRESRFILFEIIWFELSSMRLPRLN